MKYSIIIITIGVVVAVVAGMFLLWPKYQEFSNLRTQLAQAKIQLENQHKYTQQLNETDKKLSQNQELVDKVNAALPEGPDIPSLLQFLQKASIETGVSLERIGWSEVSSPQEKEKRIKEYSLNLNITGSYFAFKNFLFGLERSARFIDVVRTDFSVSPGSNQPISFDLVLKLHSY